MSGEFDGIGDHPLVPAAKFVSARSADFELSRDVFTQKLRVLIIYMLDIVLT